MKEEVFYELLNRFKVVTDTCLDTVGMESKYNMYNISMHIDLTDSHPLLTIESFGTTTLGKWKALTCSDLQYCLLVKKMDKTIEEIEAEIKYFETTENGGFSHEDRMHQQNLIFN